MFLTKRLVVTISLVAAANWAAAQDTDRWLQHFENTVPERIDEIRESPIAVVVRGSRVQPDGRTTNLVVGCGRSNPHNTFYFFVQDLWEKTDDRMAVESTICENLRSLAHQRLDAQRKQSPLQ